MVNVEIAANVSTERYSRLLAEADVAVQLRTLSNGEASAAVADCLAAGVPTIVSDLGWASELPASAVLPLPPDLPATQLAGHLLALLGDSHARQALSDAALAVARACDFTRVAEEYLRALRLT
jgi:hypothetical protein